MAIDFETTSACPKLQKSYLRRQGVLRWLSSAITPAWLAGRKRPPRGEARFLLGEPYLLAARSGHGLPSKRLKVAAGER